MPFHRATKKPLQVPSLPENQPKPDPQKGHQERPERRRSEDFMKYSGMAFQMGIVILLGALAGRQLDAYFHTPKPYLTVLCSLLAIFAALYLTLKDFFTSAK